MKNPDGKIYYTAPVLKKFLSGHKKVRNMRRKPKIGFLIPSINRYYGYRGTLVKKTGRVFIKKFLLPESVAFIDFLQLKARRAISDPPHPKGVKFHFHIKLCYPDHRVVDVDNPKAVSDSLKGILFEDDSQIFKITLEKVMGSGKHCCSIRWRKM